MVDTFFPPSAFSTQTSVQIVVAAAQTEIVDGIQSIASLLGATMNDAGTITNFNAVQSDGSAMAHPSFNHIPEATRRLFLNELSALAVAVEAHPIS